MMKNYFSLAGKNAIITGGTGNLGKVLGRVFLEYGADVVLADIIEDDKAARYYKWFGAVWPKALLLQVQCGKQAGS